MRMRARAGGFTLIEMLVAIGVMAAMAVVCWRALSFVADRRSAIEQDSLEIAQLLRAFSQLESDVEERLPDIAMPARATAAELPLSITLGGGPRGNQLEILRTVAEPSGPSRAVHVVYRLTPQGLVRTTGSGDVLLLPKAAGFTVRLYAGGFWVEENADRRVRPLVRATALELGIDDGSGGRFVKVVAL
ncbi:MAG TPA: prepilin-type N-terminal cleavage/methylation domain-containing protein [Burkholderiales bacterium]